MSKTTIPKTFLIDIAKAIVFSTGSITDSFVFDDSEDLLDEEEQKIVIEEIQKFCSKELLKLENKHGYIPTGSTQGIILAIAYEKED